MTTLPTMPPLWRGFASALTTRRAAGPLPRLSLAVGAARIDARAVERYAAACGFAQRGVPVTFPFVFAFPAVLALLSAREWPLRLPGLVHLAVAIDTFEPLQTGVPYRVECATGDAATTERGTEFPLTVTLSAAGTRVWHGVNTILARDAVRARGPRIAETPFTGQPVGHFDAGLDTARRYARASGDWNPIHVAALGARLGGFRAPIAHGMWTLARALALLGRAHARSVAARFVAPLYLPARADVLRDGHAFAVARASDGREVLRGHSQQDSR